MTGHRAVGASGPTWGRRREAVRLILAGVTFHTAWRVAGVVGTLLTLVNQGDVVVRGEMTGATWARVVANYVIPYVVASIGYLAPLREPPATPSTTRRQ